MFPIKNDVKSTNIICTGSHKFFRSIASYGGKILKRILTYLYSTKYNEINMCVIQMYKTTFPIKIV